MLLFDKDEIRLPARFLVVGRTNSGKSHYALWLLYWLCDQIDLLYIICPTAKPGEYRRLTSAAHIFDGYRPEILQDIVFSQKQLQEAGQPLPAVFIFIDDSIHDMAKGDRDVASLFTRCRHFNVSVILITQKFRAVANVIRENSDYVAIAQITNNGEKDALFSEYGKFAKKADFARLVDSVTSNRGLLIVNTTAPPDDMYVCDKAPAEIPFFYIEEAVRPDADDKALDGPVESELVV